MPVSTRGQLSAEQINCTKYNAAKKSSPHLRLKGIIRDSLIADVKSGYLEGPPSAP